MPRLHPRRRKIQHASAVLQAAHTLQFSNSSDIRRDHVRLESL